jgi:uncharacterized protein (DUF2235 family)
LDGTTDTSKGNTNVWRARSLCAPHGTDDLEQRIFYSVGVGIRVGEKLRGEVFGYGIDDQVIEAYQWLVENYDKDDEIFVFGFSRGAYAARSLSGYISRCGLIRPGSPLGVKQLYDRYRKGNAVLTIHELLEPQRDRSAYRLEEKWMVKDCEPAPVKFTGVWDTVGSVPLTNGLVIARLGTLAPSVNVTESANCPGPALHSFNCRKNFQCESSAPALAPPVVSPAIAGGCRPFRSIRNP